MPRFTTDPSTWNPPDDVDMIVAQETFEESDEYTDIVRDWMTSSDAVFEWACDRFTVDTRYATEFERWLQRRQT